MNQRNQFCLPVSAWKMMGSLVVFVGLAAPLAAVVVDNNAGAWTDDYTGMGGVFSAFQTEVNTDVGVVLLEPAETSGHYQTTVIKPSSFSAWGALILYGDYSSPGDVEILEPRNGDHLLLGAGAVSSGTLDLSGIDMDS